MTNNGRQFGVLGYVSVCVKNGGVSETRNIARAR